MRSPISRPLDYPASPAGTVNQKPKISRYVLEDSFVGLSFQTQSEHTCFLCESHLLQLYFLEYRFNLGGVKASEKKADLETQQLSTEKEGGSWLNKKNDCIIMWV